MSALFRMKRTYASVTPPRHKLLYCVLFLLCLLLFYTVCVMDIGVDAPTTIRAQAAQGDSVVLTGNLQELSDIVQRRLQYIQNPVSCSAARKVACKFDEECGYGCQVHHVVMCLIIAYATERTLTLEKQNGIYNGHSWDNIFLPLSDTCTTADGKTNGNWPTSETVQVLHVPRIYSIKPKPTYLPLAIPADLAPRLEELHPDPAAWWVAQFVLFVMRYQPATQAMVDRAMAELDINSGGIVGVHVRRTDKFREASLRNLTEYMSVVEDYYAQRGEVGLRGRVFLASDEPKVIEEAIRNYPQYHILVDEKRAESAALNNRFSEASLDGVIVDTHILSRMDYLVCTFSSNVCRLAYVMKMALSAATAHNYTSLDQSYFFAGSTIGRSSVHMPTYY